MKQMPPFASDAIPLPLIGLFSTNQYVHTAKV